jgi:hypothetical protein
MMDSTSWQAVEIGDWPPFIVETPSLHRMLHWS